MIKKTPQEVYNELMKPVLSPGRHKAIQTLAARKGLTYAQAQEYQARKVAQLHEKKK